MYYLPNGVTEYSFHTNNTQDIYATVISKEQNLSQHSLVVWFRLF